MREQAFRFGESFGRVRKTQKTSTRNVLHGDAFYKIRGRKTAAAARPTRGRQYVIAAGNVIAERLSGPRTKENRAGRANLLKKLGRAPREAEVFRREAIDEIASVLERVRNEDSACELGGKIRPAEGRFPELPFQLALNLMCESG
jgi:hypothetical protein